MATIDRTTSRRHRHLISLGLGLALLAVIPAGGPHAAPAGSTHAAPVFSVALAPATTPTADPIFGPSEAITATWQTWDGSAFLAESHAGHTATLLQDGTVLIAGGQHGARVAVPAGVEIYDPHTTPASTRRVADLVVPRSAHAAALLADGSVLVASGIVKEGMLTASAERYLPGQGRWVPTGSLRAPRVGHTLTRLLDGRVLAAGGEYGDGYADGAEVYDPLTGAWLPTGAPSVPRSHHTATLLRDGRVLVVGGISSEAGDSAELFDPRTGAWQPAGRLHTGRVGHTATLLADGRVLVAGGMSTGDGPLVTVIAAAELFDVASGQWTPAGNLVVPRYSHAATLLPDGKVLLVGGQKEDWWVTGAAEVFDPARGMWIALPPLVEARILHTATLLPSGHVLVAGGWSSDETGPTVTELYRPPPGEVRSAGSPNATLDRPVTVLMADGHVLAIDGGRAEIYDPATGAWQAAAPPPTARSDFSATVLVSGEVLVAGGRDAGGVELRRVELFDPTTGAWRAGSAMQVARSGHSATLLADGRVLVAGGAGPSDLTRVKATELYDPGSGRWQRVGDLALGRRWHSATLLRSGEVLVAGGEAGSITRLAERYDPRTGAWRPTGAMNEQRSRHSATLLAYGQVLVVAGSSYRELGGGERTEAQTDAVEIYDPQSDSWRLTAGLDESREGHAAVLLNSGAVLVAGGVRRALAGLPDQKVDSLERFDPLTTRWQKLPVALSEPRGDPAATILPSGAVLVAGGATAELYDPLAGVEAGRRPVLTAATTPIEVGGRLTIEGHGFGGGIEASGGNGGHSSATNHPVVEIRSLGNDSVFYPLLHMDLDVDVWSDTRLRVPVSLGLPAGPALVTVSANGIPSIGRIIRVLPCPAGQACLPPVPDTATIHLPWAVHAHSLPLDQPISQQPGLAESEPAVSPDGRMVAYVAQTADQQGRVLHVAPLSGAIGQPVHFRGYADIETPTFGDSPLRLTAACLSPASGGSAEQWDICDINLDGESGTSRWRPGSNERRPSRAGDFLLFDSDREGQEDIYLNDERSGVETRLTDHPAPDKLASPGPDGSVVFRSERDGNSEIYLLPPGTLQSPGLRAPRRLTYDPAFDGYPTFAPDGRSIVFQSDRRSYQRAYRMDLDGGNVRLLVPTGPLIEITPRLSPDGRILVFAKVGDAGDLDVFARILDR